MKSKLKGVLGIGFALLLVASLMLFAIPVAAGPYEDLEPVPPNAWLEFEPQVGMLGLWFYSPTIDKVGPIARAINGDLYAYVSNATTAGLEATPKNPYPAGTSGDDIFKSIDNGRTWSVSSIPNYYFNTNTMLPGGPVVDMVCSEVSEDVLYLTDGNYVFKSINGALSFSLVVADDLEKQLCGACGTAIQNGPITCIDLGYDGSGQPIVLIGTRWVDVQHPVTGDEIVGSVYWIADETFSASWTDLQVSCFGGCCDPTTPSEVGCYDVYSVATAPGFANVPKVYAVITAPLTAINFTATATATVEIRAGGYDAQIDLDPHAVATLTGTGYNAAGGVVWGPTVIDDAGDVNNHALGVNGVLKLEFTPATTGGTVDVNIDSGNISWRVVSGTGVTYCGGTRVISTLTVCSWAQVTELMWDCQWSYTIQHATRIMFPSYYGTQPTLFVGTAAVGGVNAWGEGGDVYRVADTIPPSGCIDLNVQGFTTGCAGLRHANICSLDIDDADGLLAGAWDQYQLQSPTRVYYSADGGWTWAPSKKDPTGTNRTYVLFGSAVAGTNGCDCAFSMSCGDNVGEYFNQISLISMDIDQVLDLTHSPGYVTESSMFYALTSDDLSRQTLDSDQPCYGGYSEIRSLLRWDGTYWERVHSSRYFRILALQADCAFVNSPLYDWVEVSPDFNSTSVVYMANTGFYMTRTIDAGCSWAALTYPCYDRASISAWIVVDEDTVLAAGGGKFAGYIYRTTNHGAQPWDDFEIENAFGSPACDGVDFDLSLPRAADSDVLFGDACGQVYLSYDLGETWFEIEDILTGAFNYAAGDEMMTYVVFDPGYAVADDPGENTFYAAAGTKIGRCTYNAAALFFKQDWQYLSTAKGDCVPCTLCVASGIDASGDTALYVADGGGGTGTAYVTVSGTIEIDCLPSLTEGCLDCNRDLVLSAEPVTPAGVTEVFVDNEPVEVSSWNLACTAECVFTEGEPDVYECYCKIEGKIWLIGSISGAYGYITISTTEAAESVCGAATAVADELLGTSAADDATYSGTLEYFPICAGSLVIVVTDTSETFTDQGDGTLDGDADGTGTIDYDTGEWAITLDTAPTGADTITGSYSYVDCAGPGNATVISSFLTADVPTAGTYCETGVWRTLNPLDLIDETKSWNYVEFEFLAPGALGPTSLWHPVATAPTTPPGFYTDFYVYPDDLWLTWGSNVLWALESAPYEVDMEVDSPEDIWMWGDPLAAPVIQLSPADGALLTTTTTATIEWEALDGATLYEVYVYSYCETCPDNMVLFDNFETKLTCYVLEDLEPGMTYYWKVRVACDSPKVSKWSDWDQPSPRSFDTALGAVPYLCSPWCGQADVTISTAFSWDAVFGASSYDIQVATDEAFSNLVVNDSTTVNAYTSATALDYSTVYYWRVRAVKDGVLSAWAVCIFTTAAEPVEPPEVQPPVVVEQTEITPVWIWVIIGIGGALTIAVVILIVTTRRVP